MPSPLTTLVLNAGDDRTLQLTVNDPNNPLNPENITGYTFTLLIKAQAGIDDAFALRTLAGTLVDPPNGIVDFTLRAADTAGLPPTSFYVIRAITPAGLHRAIQFGTLIARMT